VNKIKIENGQYESIWDFTMDGVRHINICEVKSVGLIAGLGEELYLKNGLWGKEKEDSIAIGIVVDIQAELRQADQIIITKIMIINMEDDFYDKLKDMINKEEVMAQVLLCKLAKRFKVVLL